MNQQYIAAGLGLGTGFLGKYLGFAPLGERLSFILFPVVAGTLAYVYFSKSTDFALLAGAGGLVGFRVSEMLQLSQAS